MARRAHNVQTDEYIVYRSGKLYEGEYKFSSLGAAREYAEEKADETGQAWVYGIRSFRGSVLVGGGPDNVLAVAIFGVDGAQERGFAR